MTSLPATPDGILRTVDTLALQFGPGSGFAPGFGFMRLFGLLFAAVALALALKPREFGTRRVVTGGGETARLEPTDAQVLVVRLLAAVFVLVGLAMAFGGSASILL